MLSKASPKAVPTGPATSSTHSWDGSRIMRELILKESFRANMGHIGSALSVVEILEVLYSKVLQINSPEDPDWDRFVLSKGHAALALYVCFYLRGWISAQQLSTFCSNDSVLGVHPEPHTRGVDFGTGSLGHGLSFACGAALAACWQKSKRRVFALISDAECNEGSTWEAAMFGGHHKLANLCVFVDQNQQQAFGYTKDIIDTSHMETIWRSLNWDVHQVDGHDIEQMLQLIEQMNFEQGSPHVILANTTFGKGVSFMENKIKWHYSPLSESELSEALAEVGKS